EVHTEANPPAVLTQMLDGQPQPARTRRSEHEPVGALRKKLFGERLAEHFIVGAKVFDLEAALRHAGRAAGLEGEDRLALQSLRQPAPDRPAAQPFIFKRRELPEVLEGGDLPSRLPTLPGGEIQPEGAARRGVEMPLHDLAHMGIELYLCLLRSANQICCG